jgi:hypothetical protein
MTATLEPYSNGSENSGNHFSTASPGRSHSRQMDMALSRMGNTSPEMLLRYYYNARNPIKYSRQKEIEPITKYFGIINEREENLAPTPGYSQDFAIHALTAILDEPVDDAAGHPARKIMERAILEKEEDFKIWLYEFIQKTEESYTIAGIVKCFTYAVKNDPPPWGYLIASRALKHESGSVREAAVDLLEVWGDEESVNLLKAHKESWPWLQEYIQEVLSVLT